MPRFDGTGPRGMGSGAGRGMGRCRNNFRFRNCCRYFGEIEEGAVLLERVAELENYKRMLEGEIERLTKGRIK